MVARPVMLVEHEHRAVGHGQSAQPSGPQTSSPPTIWRLGSRSAQARRSTWPNTSAGWAPETPYLPSMTKNGTPLAP